MRTNISQFHTSIDRQQQRIANITQPLTEILSKNGLKCVQNALR